MTFMLVSQNKSAPPQDFRYCIDVVFNLFLNCCQNSLYTVLMNCWQFTVFAHDILAFLRPALGVNLDRGTGRMDANEDRLRRYGGSALAAH